MEVITSILLTILLGILVYIIVNKFLRDPPCYRLPPGPWAFPLLGYFPFLKPRGYLAVHRIYQRFGDIAYFRLGSKRIFLLSSLRAIREAISGSNGDNFSGRVRNKFNNTFTNGQGIIFIDGPIWRAHRSFALKVLKDFGMGRSVAEVIGKQEVNYLVNYLYDLVDNKSKCDKSVSVVIAPILSESIINIISVLTMGERLSVTDPTVYQAVVGMLTASRDIGPSTNIAAYLTWFGEYFQPIIRHMPFYRDSLRNTEKLKLKIQTKLNEKRMTKLGGEPDNYIAAFLAEQYRLQEECGSVETFTDAQLEQSVIELFLAGTDTTSNTVAWAIFYLCLNPSIQQKVQGEIDSKVSKTTTSVTMEQRKELHYTSAVLDEVARCASLIPIMPHRNFNETRLTASSKSGDSYYDVPANTISWINIYSLHHDPLIWEKPDSFYPNHFLTEEGIYKTRDELIPFSVGKRSCLGEALAKMELFLFFVGLVQNFHFELDPVDNSLQQIEEITLGARGLVHSPGDFKVIITKRGK